MITYLGIDGKEREMPSLGKLLDSWGTNTEQEEECKRRMSEMFRLFDSNESSKKLGISARVVLESTANSLIDRIKCSKVVLKHYKEKEPEKVEKYIKQIECLKWMVSGLRKRIRKIDKEEEKNKKS